MKTLRLGLYRASFSYINACYKNAKHKDLVYMVSEISASSSVPCLVVASYLLEINGPNEALENNIKTLKQFCNVEEIKE